MPVPLKTRRITVCNKGILRPGSPGSPCSFFPMIQLCGKWLREAGFKPGHSIDINCKANKITITKSTVQRFNVK